jgi:hypothetical protein
MPADSAELSVDLDEAVRLLAAVFDARRIRYALVGGIAASMRGRPRFTQDVDVLLEVPQLSLPGLLEALAANGFSLDESVVMRQFTQDHLTAFRYKTVRIDWLKPILPLYARTLADASLLPWKSGKPVRVAGVEGLILTKLAAFRTQDQLDIEMLLSANRENKIDLELIRREWSAVADGEDARSAWLAAAIARTMPENS